MKQNVSHTGFAGCVVLKLLKKILLYFCRYLVLLISLMEPMIREYERLACFLIKKKHFTLQYIVKQKITITVQQRRIILQILQSITANRNVAYIMEAQLKLALPNHEMPWKRRKEAMYYYTQQRCNNYYYGFGGLERCQ